MQPTRASSNVGNSWTLYLLRLLWSASCLFGGSWLGQGVGGQLQLQGLQAETQSEPVTVIAEAGLAKEQ